MDETCRKLVAQLMPVLDRRGRRLFLGALADCLGRGGVKELHMLTGVSVTTIAAGQKQLEQTAPDPRGRGAEQTPMPPRQTEDLQAGVREALMRLLHGNPETEPGSVLCWTVRTSRQLQEDLAGEGVSVSHVQIVRQMEKMGFRMTRNRRFDDFNSFRAETGPQLSLIAETARICVRDGIPAAAVEIFRRVRVRSGEPLAGFLSAEDLGRREGFADAPADEECICIALESIRCWWHEAGRGQFPGAERLFLTVQGLGSARGNWDLWLEGLQSLAEETGLEIQICHFPPAAWRWNSPGMRTAVARRRESGGELAEVREAAVTGIGPAAEGVLPGQVPLRAPRAPEKIHMVPGSWHGEWNYSILPGADEAQP